MTQLAKNKFLFLKYSWELSLQCVHKLARRNKSICIQIDNKTTVVSIFTIKNRNQDKMNLERFHLSIRTSVFPQARYEIFSRAQSINR